MLGYDLGYLLYLSYIQKFLLWKHANDREVRLLHDKSLVFSEAVIS
jgi:hypothetical protein